jgi:hypothetical protein
MKMPIISYISIISLCKTSYKKSLGERNSKLVEIYFIMPENISWVCSSTRNYIMDILRVIKHYDESRTNMP